MHFNFKNLEHLESISLKTFHSTSYDKTMLFTVIFQIILIFWSGSSSVKGLTYWYSLTHFEFEKCEGGLAMVLNKLGSIIIICLFILG